MNILPKKRWHVRTKENIARVRRDEAQAAEEEKERERRVKLAEKEARRDFMRERARAKHGTHYEESPEKNEEAGCSAKKEHELEHVNFFAEEEAGLVSSTAVNKEHEEEKKAEKEKYEKQIGYLTYLGQDTNEATGRVSWYNKCPERDESGETSKEEMGLKHKVIADPLSSFKKYCSSTFTKPSGLPSSHSKPSISESSHLKRRRERSESPEKVKSDKSHKHNKKKSKKQKKEKRRKLNHSSKAHETDSDSNSELKDDDNKGYFGEDEVEKKLKLEKLRAERLRREREEKKKADKLMAKMNGVAYIDEDDKPLPKPVMHQRYNSQFNPDLAKQNYEDQRYRF